MELKAHNVISTMFKKLKMSFQLRCKIVCGNTDNFYIDILLYKVIYTPNVLFLTFNTKKLTTSSIHYITI